ncbi:MAG TPA: DUF3298 domain-containing protein [Devosia sp.]|nr:DUF3298 domain-containing protein [Devosia sp.]
MKLWAGFVGVVAAGFLVSPAVGASFDCAKAETPFERAICENADLSRADEILAKAFATALGGLTDGAADNLRADQREWLDFVRRACTSDAQVLSSGSYDERGQSCLVSSLNSRIDALEQSRMIGGHRFLPETRYRALQDPDEAGNPESNWPVATHEMVVPVLDGDDPLANRFNPFVQALGREFSNEDGASNAEYALSDATSDTSTTVSIKEIAGTERITLEASTYWYGHGAAHGNYGIFYVHYLVPEDRELRATDIFAGKKWEETLLDAAWDQLQAEHGEALQVEDKADIGEIVVDPRRWSFENPYGLVIQFLPYEVSAYAYGAPTVTVDWAKLETIQAEALDGIRYGF